MFKILRSGKRRKKAWKRVINHITFVGEDPIHNCLSAILGDDFTRKPPKLERFIRPSSLRFKKGGQDFTRFECSFSPRNAP